MRKLLYILPFILLTTQLYAKGIDVVSTYNETFRHFLVLTSNSVEGISKQANVTETQIPYVMTSRQKINQYLKHHKDYRFLATEKFLKKRKYKWGYSQEDLSRYNISVSKQAIFVSLFRHYFQEIKNPWTMDLMNSTLMNNRHIVNLSKNYTSQYSLYKSS